MANKELCCVDGCGKPVESRGMCGKHYQRMKNSGTTEIKRTEKGSVRAWLDNVAIPFAGDECLPFPFYRSVSGHGRISNRKGGPALAHVYVAEAVHGAKPTEGYESCHRCGNAPCCNPRHLYWGTRAQNMADRITHGVLTPPPVQRGRSNVNTKLTEDNVREIRARIGKEPIAQIARDYGVNSGTIHTIKDGRSWSWLS
jgi:hypothetical protein